MAVNFLAKNPFVAANQPGNPSATGPTENLVLNTIKHVRRTRWDGKIDHQFTANHKIFARYSQARHRAWKGDYQAQFAWRDIDPNAQPAPVDHVNVAFSDMFILSPTMNNEFRMGFNRRARRETALTKDGDWAKTLGIPNVSGQTFPNFNIGYGLAGLPSFQNIGEDFTFQDNVTKITGKHTIKFGYELIRTRYNSTGSSLPGGPIFSTFTGTEPAPFTPNTGNTLASFLLGTVQSATYTQDYATWLPRWWSHQWYAQTDWKPRPGLTLNLGLRWSYESPFNTKYGQQAQFDPTVKDPISGLMGAIVHPKNALGERRHEQFCAAHRPGLELPSEDGFPLVIRDRPPGHLRHRHQHPIPGIPGDGQPSIADRRSPARIPPLAGSAPVHLPGAARRLGAVHRERISGRSAQWYDPNMRMPYVASWSGGIQWEFANNFVLDTTYQGQAGVGLINSWDINAIPLNISKDPVVLNQIFTATQNYKPYPQFGSINLISNFGHNTYHGGTIRVEKRYSQGLSFNAFYTSARASTRMKATAPTPASPSTIAASRRAAAAPTSETGSSAS